MKEGKMLEEFQLQSRVLRNPGVGNALNLKWQVFMAPLFGNDFTTTVKEKPVQNMMNSKICELTSCKEDFPNYVYCLEWRV
jgi:hypothetical protein